MPRRLPVEGMQAAAALAFAPGRSFRALRQCPTRSVPRPRVRPPQCLARDQAAGHIVWIGGARKVPPGRGRHGPRHSRPRPGGSARGAAEGQGAERCAGRCMSKAKKRQACFALPDECRAASRRAPQSAAPDAVAEEPAEAPRNACAATQPESGRRCPTQEI